MNNAIPLIGADPEVFVGYDRNPQSVIGFIGGTKEEPLAVAGGAVQEDNVLLEYNIDPASTKEEFVERIVSVRLLGAQMLHPFGMNIIENLSSHLYDEDLLRSFGPQAYVFGCEPDYNCWTRRQNVMPNDAPPTLRTAGGHVHIGFGHIERVTKATTREVMQMCDYLLGLASVLLDGDTQRKKLYGKAGAMRYKPYGGEYRSLSNFWIFSVDLTEWVYEMAVRAYTSKHLLEEYKSIVSGDEVQRIINENDGAAAVAALKALGVVYE